MNARAVQNEGCCSLNIFISSFSSFNQYFFFCWKYGVSAADAAAWLNLSSKQVWNKIIFFVLPPQLAGFPPFFPVKSFYIFFATGSYFKKLLLRVKQVFLLLAGPIQCWRWNPCMFIKKYVNIT
ncbi:hypothetical protein BX661DRAFT_19613 [Kickxella alabastrina]|uniref:uncharacterized protein n=1 Tax=Kickxella alabastrina TaxID=61397 RepID=UPI00221E884E|nr:uncharacterized protein BX661DRAFT_19613 [Kickxella alabastrina]KAI7818555.1 hypothetical protein BX661DRAFT_19613 [Kickxella alabastrina]